MFSRVILITKKILNNLYIIFSDLFRFIESFVKPVQHNNQEVLIMPTNILEKWLKKTFQKIEMNPYFWKQ